MLNRRRQQGITLLELMVGVSIVALVLALGAPSFARWAQDARNRGAAESIANGLQVARSEAVGRNALVRFSLTSATADNQWTVTCVNDVKSCPTAAALRTYTGTAGPKVGVSLLPIPAGTSPNPFATAIAAATDVPAGVSFNGLGRVPTANANADITRIDITSPIGRRYVVTVSNTGQIRMCDPNVALATSPQGCR
jgi:type IV fimbrial biogenesis protein FimT